MNFIRRYWRELLGCLLAALVLLTCVVAGAQVPPLAPLPRGVHVPQGGFSQDRTTQTGPQAFRGPEQVPPDDFHKWHVSVFVGEGEPSQRLVRDLTSHPELSQLRNWGHLNIYDQRDQYQKARVDGYTFKVGFKTPYLVVHPPKGGAYPYQEVYTSQGYNEGDAHETYAGIQQMVTAFRAKYDKVTFGSYNPNCPNCPDPYRPAPIQPLRPNTPPVVPPIAPPPLPDITPNVLPDNPVWPNNPKPELGQFPQYPQVTLVIDSRSMFECANAELLIGMARRLAEAGKYGFTNAKARWLDIRDGESQAFPVGPGDTPVIYVTENGALLDTIRGHTLQTMLGILPPSNSGDRVPLVSDEPNLGRLMPACDPKCDTCPIPKTQPQPQSQPKIEPPTLDLSSIIPSVVKGVTDALKTDVVFIAACKGPPGADGKDGADGSQGPIGPAPSPAEVQAAVESYFASHPTSPPGSRWSHLILVAPESASYLARLDDLYSRAKGHWSHLRRVLPPAYEAGEIPALVAYQDGKPEKVWRGLRQVEEALTALTRGEFDSFLKREES